MSEEARAAAEAAEARCDELATRGADAERQVAQLTAQLGVGAAALSELRLRLAREREEAAAASDELHARAEASDEAARVLRARLEEVLCSMLEARREPTPPSGAALAKLLREASAADAWPIGALPDAGILPARVRT